MTWREAALVITALLLLAWLLDEWRMTKVRLSPTPKVDVTVDPDAVLADVVGPPRSKVTLRIDAVALTHRGEVVITWPLHRVAKVESGQRVTVEQVQAEVAPTYVLRR